MALSKARHVGVPGRTANTTKLVLINETDQFFNNTSGLFENYNAANIATYGLSMTEQGATGYYSVSVPGGVSSAGLYAAPVVYCASTTMALTDFPAVSSAEIDWKGAADGSLNDLSSRLPAALVSSRMDSSVGAVASGAITSTGFAAGAIDASAIATDAIGSAEISAAAVTKIQAGLSTLDGTGVQTALTNQGYTAARAGYLDTLNGLVANIWSYARASAGALATTTMGRWFYDFLNVLGTDFRPKVSADAHTGGVTITAVTGAVGSVTGAVGSVTGNVGGNVTGSVGSVVGAVGSVTGNVGGNVTGSVGSVTSSVTVGTNNDKTGYALTSGERDSIAAAQLDLTDGVETGLTERQALRLMVAALAGKISGAGTTTIVIRNSVADTKARITATVDSSGNRTAITTDLT